MKRINPVSSVCIVEMFMWLGWRWVGGGLTPVCVVRCGWGVTHAVYPMVFILVPVQGFDDIWDRDDKPCGKH